METRSTPAALILMTDYLAFSGYLLGYAVCSGANVGFFAFSLRRLKRDIGRGHQPTASNEEKHQAIQAETILAHLQDPNWTLASILLTNVGFGVQLSQLSDSLFTGIMAVIMPILAITLVGEFFSQATFLRFTGKLCTLTSPLIWFVKYLTFPLSWPLARLVDALLGKEGLSRLSEKDLLADLELELNESAHPEELTGKDHLDPRELKILMNVAKADDELAQRIGEALDPKTIITLPFKEQQPVFPDDWEQFIKSHLSQAFHPWFVLVDASTSRPQVILDADGFIRAFHSQPESFNPFDHVYRIRIYTDSQICLGPIVSELIIHEEHKEDDVIDIDVVIIWSAEGKWILTGGDILGRFLKGVPRKRHWRSRRENRRRSEIKTD